MADAGDGAAAYRHTTLHSYNTVSLASAGDGAAAGHKQIAAINTDTVTRFYVGGGGGDGGAAGHCHVATFRTTKCHVDAKAAARDFQAAGAGDGQIAIGSINANAGVAAHRRFAHQRNGQVAGGFNAIGASGDGRIGQRQGVGDGVVGDGAAFVSATQNVSKVVLGDLSAANRQIEPLKQRFHDGIGNQVVAVLVGVEVEVNGRRCRIGRVAGVHVAFNSSLERPMHIHHLIACGSGSAVDDLIQGRYPFLKGGGDGGRSVRNNWSTCQLLSQIGIGVVLGGHQNGGAGICRLDCANNGSKICRKGIQRRFGLL